jgi:transketolase
MRYASYGWHVQTVDDVNNTDALRIAISNAKADTDRPSIIKVIYYFNFFIQKIVFL